MNDYEAKRQARIDRLRDRADRKAGEANALHTRAESMASVIPMGQPILIGHHSEKRDRNYRARIDSAFTRSFEASKEATELARRVDAAESNEAISSDDPDAIEKLRAKLAAEEAEHERLKADCSRARKLVKTTLSAGGYLQKAEGLQAHGVHPYIVRGMRYGGRIPSLTNSSANLRRIRERIAELEKRAAAPEREPEQIGDVRIIEEENRVRLFFPGKPSEEHRKLLKSWGFRWSPTAGAWQRHANTQGWVAARLVAEAIAKDKVTP